MFTQCPHCSTLYPVEPAQLAEAHGRLCCGSCGQEFDGLERLAETPERIGTVTAGTERPPRVDPLVDPQQADLFSESVTPNPTPNPTPESTAESTAEPSPEPTPRSAVARPRPPTGDVPVSPPPSFARRRPAEPRGRRLGWVALAAVLAVTLGLQAVFAQRNELAADPRWRPLLERVCAHLRCTLPAWRDTDDLQLVEREIGPHPSVPDALLVTVTVRNDAAWAQAWPLLELTLSDLHGEPVAMRRFRADEYLGQPPESPTLAAGQTATARLEIADPGKQAVAFGFEFR